MIANRDVQYLDRLNKDIHKTIEKIELRNSPRVFEPLQRIDEQTLQDFNKITDKKKVKKSPYLSHVSAVSTTSSILDKMKIRLADNKSSEKREVNEINFSKSHKFDFIKSETLGGLKNLK